MKLSTGLRNGLLSGDDLKALLDGGEIRVYEGAVPSTADDSIGSAVLLGTYKNGGSGITFDAAVNGVISKAAGETWGGTIAATGTPSFFRHVLSSDDGSASSTALRIQGTCGLVGADLNMASLSWTSGGTMQPIESYAITIA